MKKRCNWGSFPAAVLLALALVLGGCSGGISVTVADPPPPPTAPEPEPEPELPPGDIVTTPPDPADLNPPQLSSLKYSIAHDLPAPRGAAWVVTGITPGDTLTINIRVTVNGAPRPGLSRQASDPAYVLTGDGAGNYLRLAVAEENLAVSDLGNGNYTITVSGLAEQTWWGNDASWLIQLKPDPTTATYPQATIVAHQTAEGAPVKDLVTDRACINCHGERVFIDARGGFRSNARAADGSRREMAGDYHFSAYGVEACVICHGDSEQLTAYIHGIHNSDQVNRSFGSGSLEIEPGWTYAVRYPGDLRTCNACHQSAASLEQLRDQPVTLEFCASCHGATHARTGQYTIDWDSFNWSNTSFEDLHKNFVALADNDCSACHISGGIAPAQATDYHPGFDPDLQLAADLGLALEITGVQASGSGNPVRLTWRAYDQNGGGNFNACNTGPGAPVFFGNFLLRLSSLQGDDVVNHLGGSTTAPGQPGPALELGAANTVCDANGVATTTLSAVAPAAYRAMVSFDGRPRVDGRPARVPVPTQIFRVENGQAHPRRPLVDSAKCLACHLGSLYRHEEAGGGRNDNIEVCLVCHNPAATDQQQRRDFYNVGAAAAYDRKNAESFSFAGNMHAIHAAGATNAFYAVYGPSSIQAYGGAATFPPDWLLDDAGNARAGYIGPHGDAARVFHSLKKVNYPRLLTDCLACHVDEGVWLPDQGGALAVSIDSGPSMGNQNDDTLISPAAAACMSCHRGTPAVTNAMLNHAYSNSWQPQVFERGKHSVLEGERLETCLVCHGQPAP